MARHKDAEWNLPGPSVTTWEQASVAVLMDIRDELKALNRTMQCRNTQMIPQYLRDIRRNTTKRKKK